MLHPDLRIITPETYLLSLDIRYATTDNFTGALVYQHAHCYLHKEAEAALVKALSMAQSLGYGFKIFDAFRPSEAQSILWAHTPDPNFLAPPERGSPHSRGVAVDLTLTDNQGRELDMGTGFDAFTPLSHHGNQEISVEAQQNRIILLGIMTAAGWDFYRNEWWHYQLFDSRSYALLDDATAGTHMM